LTNHIAKIILFFLLVSKINFAQTDTTKKNYPSLSDSVFVMQKSPWGAVLRSAIIPGWGQIYNQSYFKAPIIWGLSAWLTYLWFWNNRNYKEAANNYFFYNQQYQNSGNPNDQSLAASYFSNKNFYQDQRDLVAIYMGLTYLLNLVDAYVDAELFDFSIQENSVSHSPMLNMRINF
jgi:hypothetical protein